MQRPERPAKGSSAEPIGDGEVFDGQYGPRPITYADYTASGRALEFVEN